MGDSVHADELGIKNTVLGWFVKPLKIVSRTRVVCSHILEEVKAAIIARHSHCVYHRPTNADLLPGIYGANLSSHFDFRFFPE